MSNIRPMEQIQTSKKDRWENIRKRIYLLISILLIIIILTSYIFFNNLDLVYGSIISAIVSTLFFIIYEIIVQKRKKPYEGKSLQLRMALKKSHNYFMKIDSDNGIDATIGDTDVKTKGKTKLKIKIEEFNM